MLPAHVYRARALLAATVVCLASAAHAGTHSDALGDQAGTNESEADISSVQIANDSSNLHFRITA